MATKLKSRGVRTNTSVGYQVHFRNYSGWLLGGLRKTERGACKLGTRLLEDNLYVMVSKTTKKVTTEIIVEEIDCRMVF